MKQKRLTKMYTFAKKYYKTAASFLLLLVLVAGFLVAKENYRNADFGNAFQEKATAATKHLDQLNNSFILCSKVCNSNPVFMKSLVFPEVMRFHQLKDDVETESLRTLYVQFGKEYADFSIGLFQMKPSFAEQMEIKANTLLSTAVYHELQLGYNTTDPESIRRERIDRLQNTDWQLIYLTAFIAICNKQFETKSFTNELHKLQWYATVYNAGFERSETYLQKKIQREALYLQQNMPQKKFRYAALAGWYYQTHTNSQIR